MNTTTEYHSNRPNDPCRHLVRRPASSRNDEIGNRRYMQYLWTETARRRKSRRGCELEEIILFLIGFDHGYADAAAHPETVDRTVFNTTWRSFLANSHGCKILAGKPYPDTESTILRDAKSLFWDGYGYGIEWAKKELELEQNRPVPA